MFLYVFKLNELNKLISNLMNLLDLLDSFWAGNEFNTLIKLIPAELIY